MTDIVERLRSLKWLVHDEMRGLIADQSAYEAADEILALRAENAKLRELGDAMVEDGYHSDFYWSTKAWKDYRNE